MIADGPRDRTGRAAAAARYSGQRAVVAARDSDHRFSSSQPAARTPHDTAPIAAHAACHRHESRARAIERATAHAARIHRPEKHTDDPQTTRTDFGQPPGTPDDPGRRRQKSLMFDGGRSTKLQAHRTSSWPAYAQFMLSWLLSCSLLMLRSCSLASSPPALLVLPLPSLALRLFCSSSLLLFALSLCLPPPLPFASLPPHLSCPPLSFCAPLSLFVCAPLCLSAWTTPSCAAGAQQASSQGEQAH